MIEKMLDELIEYAEMLGASKMQKRSSTKEKKYQKLVNKIKKEIIDKFAE